MSLQFALQETTKLDLSSFERFTKLIDPVWIEQALAMTGTVSIRRRRLPADRIVWLVGCRAGAIQRPTDLAHCATAGTGVRRRSGSIF